MDAQRLDGHKRVLGILYVISGSLTVIGMLMVNAVMTLIFSFIFDQADAEEQRVIELVTAIMAYLPWLIIIFLAAPTIIAGLGLLTRQSWAVILSLIIGCIKLFSFPIGTVIGIYAIWIFSEDQKMSRSNTSS